MRYGLVGLVSLAATALILAACDSGDEEAEDADPIAAEVTPAEEADATPAEEADAPVVETVSTPLFGTEDDVAYAAAMWTALGDAALVGEQSIHAPFYEGAEPHGFVLETIFAELTMGDITAPVIVKRNYGPEGITVDEVATDPAAHLDAITVMYQRVGFNDENNDWFWVKYLPDGTLDVAGENGMAGNVGGCIGCHVNAPGDDWIFVTDRILAEPYVAGTDGEAVRDVFGGDPP